MKRIFEVNGEYFADKQAAKAARGEPVKPAHTASVQRNGNTVEVQVPAQYKYEIHKGPDHQWFGVKRGHPRTHSHDAKAGGHGNGFPIVRRKR